MSVLIKLLELRHTIGNKCKHCMDNKKDIFEAFRRNITNKIFPYLLGFNFTVENSIIEDSEWINAKFQRKETILNFSVSLHHLDYADGIIITLKSKFGNKELRNEVTKYYSKETPIYLYFLDCIDMEFDRILRDLKLNFEKYLEE